MILFFKTTLSLLFYVLNLFTSRISFIFPIKNFFNYFYFWLHRVFVATHGLSLVVVSGGDSLVAVSGLVIAAVSLVAGHEKCAQASAVVAHELSCPLVCGSFPDQGLNQCPLQWQVDSLPLDHQGSPTADSWATLFWGVFVHLYLDYILLNNPAVLHDSWLAESPNMEPPIWEVQL